MITTTGCPKILHCCCPLLPLLCHYWVQKFRMELVASAQPESEASCPVQKLFEST
jgi:hypothetical protein